MLFFRCGQYADGNNRRHQRAVPRKAELRTALLSLIADKRKMVPGRRVVRCFCVAGESGAWEREKE